MKYMLDILLVVGLLWIGWLWNGEKQRGLALEDDIDQLKANVARLELDLKAAADEGDKAASDLETARTALEGKTAELAEASEALAAQTAEAADLQAKLKTAVSRIKELEGYKAKAIVAEMPKPIAE